ncbi:MAG TPA: hypothetical protein VHE59_10880 [Mucilaginibacter sp.]|nr:hypothetical protein [Mucilaginibacter sp.]
MIIIESFKLLDYLKKNGGLHNKISIAKLIDEYVTIPPDFNGYPLMLSPLYRLMAKLEKDGLIEYAALPSPNGSTYTWETVKNIFIELTTKGDDYLKENLRHDMEFRVNQLLLDSNQLAQEVNESVIATNKSIVDTNTSMVSIAQSQATSNGTIASNTTSQTRFIRKQTKALYVTAIFALGALLISYRSCSIAQATYDRDTSKSQLEQSVKRLQIDTSKLSKRLIQIKIDSTHLSGEVETLKKSK